MRKMLKASSLLICAMLLFSACASSLNLGPGPFRSEMQDVFVQQTTLTVPASHAEHGEDYVIEWQDPVMEKHVRKWLDRPKGDIYHSDVWDYQRVSINSGTGVGDLIVKDAPDGVIFRKDSVSVSNAAQKEIHRGLYPENKIIEAMDHALAFLNGDSCDPLVRISAFHYLVGYIHPFYNGNGRLSRFISSYLLSDELNFLIGYRLSYTVKDNIKQYYDSFKVCNSVRNRGDLTPFVLSFLDIIQKAMKQLEAALLRRKADYDKYMKMISRHPFGEKEKDGDLLGYLIQASLFSGHGIATKMLEGMLGISYTPLKNRLAILRQEQLLVEEKIGREKFYRLNLTEFEKQVESRG